MKLFSLIKYIEDICKTIPNVNTVLVGDVYDLNELQDIKYSAMVITEQNHSHNVDNDYDVFGLNIFYVDRETSDKSNILDVHSHATEALERVVEAIEEIGGLIENQYSITTFVERFDSVCAGAYATLNVRVYNEDCQPPRIVTSVNGMVGDVVIKGGGSGDVTKDYLNQRLEDYYLKTQVDELIGDVYNSMPTTTSELTNDSGYITIEDVPEYEEQIVYFYYSPTLNGSEILSLVNSGKKVILRDNMGWGADYFNFEFFAYSQRRMAGAPAIDYMYFMCLDGRRITWSGVNGEEGSWTTYYDENVHKTELPTKLSQLQNDRDYVSETEVDEILYPYALKSELPTKVSDLENDRNYVRETPFGIAENGVFLSDKYIQKGSEPVPAYLFYDAETRTLNIITNEIWN